jgi:hypothetical protein
MASLRYPVTVHDDASIVANDYQEVTDGTLDAWGAFYATHAYIQAVRDHS